MERLYLRKAGWKAVGIGALMAATLAAAAAQTVNLNCGGAAFTTSDGTQWSADSYYNGGDLLYSGYSIAGIQPQDYFLYRTARAGLYGDFSYSIPLANGTYMVKLIFAETQYTGIGERVFNVAVNGSTVLSNFDILAHVPVLTAFSQQFAASVTNGVLKMDFTGVTRRALVSAIQVTPASNSSQTQPAPPTPVLSVSGNALSFAGTAGNANPPAQTVTVSTTASWTAASNASWLTVSPGSGTGNGSLSIGANLAGLAGGNYSGTITVTAPGATGSPQTVAVSLTVTAAPAGNPPSSTTPFISINCGGSATTGADGTNWLADQYYTGGDLYYSGYMINGTPDLYLYRTARRGLYGNFSYTVPVPNGSYILKLKFAEAAYGSRGQRVFNVNVNGSPVLTNFDIVADVGALMADDKMFPVTVTNGTLQIDFIGVVGYGLVSGIQLLTSGGTPPPPTLSLSSSSLSFAGTSGGANPAGQGVTVSNIGTGTLTWTAASNQNWLTVSPASGTNTGTLTIGANLAGLGAGTYSGTVTVSGGGSSKPITAVLTVAAPPASPPASPALSVSPTSLTFSATAGGASPAAQTVGISNSGGGTLSWTASSNQAWLFVSPSSGGNSGSLTVSVNTGALSAGTYYGAANVNGGAAGSTTVNVTLSLAASAPSSPPNLPTGGNSWFVTTSGSPGGDGSAARPWDLATALLRPSAVKPGDTIWVRGGRYGGGQYNSLMYSTLVGTAASPIVVRAYPGERVTIDTWVQVGCCDGAPDPSKGSYTWFWGLEFAGFNPDRSTAASGPPSYSAANNHNSADVWGAGSRFINCIVHDTAGGISLWNAANAELTGNIIYNVGGYGPDRGHGHLFYLQNQAPSVVTVNDNIGFNNFDMGIQAYGSGSNAYVQNIAFNGNVIFNSGVLYGKRADNLLVGGGIGGPSGISVKNNYFYNPPAAIDGYNELGYPWTTRAGDLVATGNYFIGGSEAVDVMRWQSAVFQNNTIYNQAGLDESIWILGSGQSFAGYQVGGNRYFGNGHFMVFTGCDGWPCPNGVGMGFSAFQSATGLDLSSTYSPGAPTGVQTFVRANAYEPGRANIVVFNWSMQGSVQVDLSGSGIKAGDSYQIRDAQNWYGGPVVSGMYSGAAVTVPMTGLTLVQPVGTVPNPATHTAPLFGTFVLLSGPALANTY
jgi:hypothetical protein